MKKSDRFICVYKKLDATVVKVFVDTQTGINYLFIREGFSGGLTPLLGADGNPIKSSEYILK